MDVPTLPELCITSKDSFASLRQTKSSLPSLPVARWVARKGLWCPERLWVIKDIYVGLWSQKDRPVWIFAILFWRGLLVFVVVLYIYTTTWNWRGDTVCKYACSRFFDVNAARVTTDLSWFVWLWVQIGYPKTLFTTGLVNVPFCALWMVVRIYHDPQWLEVAWRGCKCYFKVVLHS